MGIGVNVSVGSGVIVGVTDGDGSGVLVGSVVGISVGAYFSASDVCVSAGISSALTGAGVGITLQPLQRRPVISKSNTPNMRKKFLFILSLLSISSSTLDCSYGFVCSLTP